MSDQQSYTVGQVARLAGVTVRTLHHYDEIGLLPPSGRAANGYRTYTRVDVARLQRILNWRELGFDLEQVAELVATDGSSGAALEQLRRQHALLLTRIDRLQAVAATVQKTLEAHTMRINLTPEEMLEVFGDHDPTEHAAEAEERWGDTDAWNEIGCGAGPPRAHPPVVLRGHAADAPGAGRDVRGRPEVRGTL